MLFMNQININHVKQVKEVVDFLNKFFPAPLVKTSKIIDNERKNLFKQTDDIFYSYFDKRSNMWWIVCIDYFIWNELNEYLKEFCKTLTHTTKVNFYNCNVHPVFVSELQRKHNDKKIFLIGKCNWFKK